MNNVTKIIVKYHDREVGAIILTANGLCAFEYSSRWLADGFSISPFELPLKNGVFIARPQPFAGGFGIFDDSLPDGWGMLILDRYLQKNGINLRSLSILDRLALVGSTGRGALEFEPENISELKKIFRLMSFNYLIGNKDDHAKNFSFIYKNNEWRFAPGYDLLPSDGMNGYHLTSINDKITPVDDDLITVATKFGLDANESARTLSEMRERVKSVSNS